jgi:hypothetical protein
MMPAFWNGLDTELAGIAIELLVSPDCIDENTTLEIHPQYLDSALRQCFL